VRAAAGKSGARDDHRLEAPSPLSFPEGNLLIWLALLRHGHLSCKVRVACEEGHIARRKIVR
jgi:hypothetical protein